MQLRKPFLPLEDYLADPKARSAIQPLAPIRIPPNVPVQYQQQILNNVAANANQQATEPAYQVAYEYVFAVCESARLASAFLSSGSMSASLQAGGEIKLNMVQDKAGWRTTVISPQPVGATVTAAPKAGARKRTPAKL